MKNQQETTQVWRDCVAIRMFDRAVVGSDTQITLDAESSTVEPLHVDSFFTNDRIADLICFTSAAWQEVFVFCIAWVCRRFILVCKQNWLWQQ